MPRYRCSNWYRAPKPYNNTTGSYRGCTHSRLPEIAQKLYLRLKKDFNVYYDDKGAVGRRYRRQDEAGTPFCFTVDGDTLKVTKRLEAELGEEQASFIEGEPSDWELLPPPEGCFKVGIDGGYVRNWVDKKHKFEVIVGKSIRRFDESAAEVEAPSLREQGDAGGNLKTPIR